MGEQVKPAVRQSRPSQTIARLFIVAVAAKSIGGRGQIFSKLRARCIAGTMDIYISAIIA